MLKLISVSLLIASLAACITTESSAPNVPIGASENIAKCKEGWQLTEKGHYSRAVDWYFECIETGNLSNSTLSRTYRNIGITYRRMGEYETAIEYFDKAITLNPADIQNDYINRGNARSGLRQYDMALADYEKALEIKPNNGAAVFNRGIVYERLGRTDEAISDFKLAPELGYYSPDLVERLRFYGIKKI